MQEQKTNPSQPSENLDNWFAEFIAEIVHSIKSDKLMLETNTAPEQTKKVYDGLRNNDPLPIIHMARRESSKFFIGNLVTDFIRELNSNEVSPVNIALSYSNSHVLVWIEINDDDDVMEDKILISEAKINALYHKYGYNLNATIIERSDKIPVPPHFKKLELN